VNARTRSTFAATSALLACAGGGACGGRTLDAGADRPQGLLPVDERNPIILSNDGPYDNWDGEYAIVLASLGKITLAGIIVNSSPTYPTIDDNVQGWRDMVQAARNSGMRNIPDPTTSVDGTPLEEPADGGIGSTEPHHTEGGRLIVDTAHRLSQPLRPIVVATGGRLTEVADAYLIDPSIADEVVVVASLGHVAPDGGSATVSNPNGDIDPWADEIVVRNFRYVQVDAYYAQQNDIPTSMLAALPDNPFRDWISAKLAQILPFPAYDACDQNSVIASAFPDFALGVARMSESSSAPLSAGSTPSLEANDAGNCWVVIQGNNALASARFWQALTNPATY
jgi:hypothetical protein